MIGLLGTAGGLVTAAQQQPRPGHRLEQGGTGVGAAQRLPETWRTAAASWSDKQEGDHELDGRILRLAEGLALLSASPDHLARACAQLARLDPAGGRLSHADRAL